MAKKKKSSKASVSIKVDNIDKLCKDKAKKCVPTSGNCGGCAYILAALGAAIYYISTATGFWNGVLGILKALVWPVFLVFELMKFLGM
ncbi:hypothetical protein ACFL6I_26885 [candidate division KSB1 bacterium]